MGPLLRCVGRGRVLDNLMFSTLTPFLSPKWVWGLLPKRRMGWTRLPTPQFWWLSAGAEPWGLSRICPLPTLAGTRPGSLALADTFSERVQRADSRGSRCGLSETQPGHSAGSLSEDLPLALPTPLP